jgi:hypothetical protein
MKEIWLKFLEATGKAFWVEITTEQPRCTYYFGPFATEIEAKEASPGYIEDLKEEGSQGIRFSIKQMKPRELTIDHSLGEILDPEIIPALSGQGV